MSTLAVSERTYADIPAVRQHSIGQAIVLQLLPGLATAILFVIGVASLNNLGLPNIFALYGAILLGEIPVTLALMFHLERQEHGRVSLRNLFPHRDPLPTWQYIALGLPLIVWSVAIIGEIGPAMQQPLVPVLFAWVPEDFILEFSPEALRELSRATLMILMGLSFMATAAVGGLVQEVYSRGYLLPRLAWLGLLGPAVNAALFALSHLISPWSWPAFFVMTLAWSYAVYWKKSMVLGVIAHSGMLLLSWVMMAVTVLA